MGQYYKIVNLGKKEWMSNWDFGGGVKLCEHGRMIMECLVALLAESNGRGGGDINSQNPIIGSWAGDRIIFAGDYADANSEFSRPVPVWNDITHSWENGPGKENIFTVTETQNWKNISIDIFLAVIEDNFIRDYFLEVYTDGEHWYRNMCPSVIVALAYALKNIEELPQLGNKAAWAFRTLFGDNTVDYYRNMNGLIKHHSIPNIYEEHLNR
jgi:hypothetical protein